MRFSDKKKKITAITLVIAILNQLFCPTIAHALTDGPRPPEAKGFQPIDASNMVDMFTGDFKYNIPLFEIGSYPMNLTYAASPGMEEEASWVGLGWSLNPGMINRTVRGFPDDFKGDSIVRFMNMKPDYTIGVTPGIGAEFFGFLGLSLNAGIFYNNYKGWGFEGGVSPSLKIGDKSTCANTSNLSLSGNFSFNSQSGIGLGVGLGYASRDAERRSSGLSLNLNGYNSRQGLKELSWGINATSKDKEVVSGLSDGSISFSSPTYMPVPEIQTQNENLTFRVTVGSSAIGLNPHASLVGYKTKQNLKRKRFKREAYGYYYNSDGQKKYKALQDYNRDKPVPYRSEMSNISPVIGTYDLFNVSSQNGGGQFRLFRNDIGVFGETSRSSTSPGGKLSVELGFGSAFHAGSDVNIARTTLKAQKWLKDNNAKDYLLFRNNVTTGNDSNIISEPVYFAMNDEIVKNDTAFAFNYGDKNPAYLFLHPVSNSPKVIAERRFVKTVNNLPSGFNPIQQKLFQNKRVARNQNIIALNANEASFVGVEKDILAYYENQFNKGDCINDNYFKRIPRLKYRKNHFSEFDITNMDGSRNIYGIPIYNNFQKEFIFSTNEVPDANNLVTVQPNDDTPSNQRGVDNYFNSEETPAYATGYLLTGVLSPDYVDRTGDGITPDDLGNGIKFNYSMISDYQWRSPMIPGKARFNPGSRADSEDNKASYVYGKKDIWYMHSIESNMEVAHFYTSPRNDGFGVQGTSGLIDTSSSKALRKLDSILIYSRADLIENKTNALPLKTIVFEYATNSVDQLCKNLPNAKTINDGKLTLKGVYTKYQKNRIKYNYYQFRYKKTGPNNVNYNPNYNINAQDRWGQYRSIDSANLFDFPYTWQDAIQADIKANAYNIDSVLLPSGGAIQVNYEPDDYAYIQNKRAGQMMFVKGFKRAGSVIDSVLFNQPGQVNDSIIVSMPFTIPYQIANLNKIKREIKQRYFEDIEKELYFNFLMDISGKNQNEYISGYIEIDTSGVSISEVKNNLVTSLAIPVKKIKTDRGTEMHPVTRIANQKLRTDLQKIAFPVPSVFDFKLILSFISEMKILLKGFDDKFMGDGFSKKILISNKRSWVRLTNPTYAKIGGGSRVKTIEIHDMWATMDNTAEGARYTKSYAYKTKSVVNGVATDISSGVASWEPALGNEENLFRVPEFFTEKIKLAPDNSYYTEKPTGEGLYPSPQVGYSEVTERNVTSREDNSSNGFRKLKFYTAKDFPTITSRTEMNRIPKKSNLLSGFMKIRTYNYDNVSQGFVIEVNNMHGKMKEEATYNENGDHISSTIYDYLMEKTGNSALKLKNSVLTIIPSGVVEYREMGVKQDIWQEFSEESTTSTGKGAALNTDGFMVFLPMVVPVVIPIWQKEQLRLRWSSTTKFVNRIGILSKVTKIQDGASISTDNLYFDSETGNPLVTSVDNEFGNKVFNSTFPCHWAYPRMGSAYKNSNLECNGIKYDLNTNNGFIDPVTTNPQFYNSLEEGDEVLLGGTYYSNALMPIWRRAYIKISNGGKYIIDNDGRLIRDFPYIKVIRSGRRNQLTSNVYQYSSARNPVVGNNFSNSAQSLKILDAKAYEYKDFWPIEEKITRQESCVGRLYGSDTINKLLADVLVSFDTFWLKKASDNISVYKIISSKFNWIDSNTVWYGDTIKKMVYYNISKQLFANPYLVDQYEAKIGKDLVYYIYSQNCSFAKKENDNRELVTTACDPFDLRELYINNQCSAFPFYINFSTPSSLVKQCYYTSCIFKNDCSSLVKKCVNNSIGDTFNVFTSGMVGNWRPYKSYYQLNRRNTVNNTNTASVYDSTGFVMTYGHPWRFTNGQLTFDPNMGGGAWTTENIITKYNARGNEIENVNVANIPGTALYGYDKNLVTLTAKNARLRNVAYDGMEEWTYSNKCTPGPTCFISPHFDLFTGNTINSRVTNKMHTGRYSLQVNASQTINLDTIYASAPTDDVYPIDSFYTVPVPGVNNTSRIKQKGILPKFYPDTGTYVLSAWIQKGVTDTSASIKVKVNSCGGAFAGTTYTFKPSGPVIEGWQRVYGFFNIAPGTPCAGATRSVEFSLTGGTTTAYFDDLRIHPFNAIVKTYVYDHFFNRLSATLDENNYATFYEYDDAGNLVRVKKETERGIMTIKEHRQYLRTEN